MIGDLMKLVSFFAINSAHGFADDTPFMYL